MFFKLGMWSINPGEIGLAKPWKDGWGIVTCFYPTPAAGRTLVEGAYRWIPPQRVEKPREAILHCIRAVRMTGCTRRIQESVKQLDNQVSIWRVVTIYLTVRDNSSKIAQENHESYTTNIAPANGELITIEVRITRPDGTSYTLTTSTLSGIEDVLDCVANEVSNWCLNILRER